MKNEKEIAKSNYEMLKSYAKEFIHHGMELQKALKKEKEIDAWVVAKAERATTDLSDITHYLDGKSEYAKGGGVKNMKLPKDAKIRINYVDVSVYKDSYEEGETDNVNNYDMNHIKGSIVNPKELVSFLAKNIYTSKDTSYYSIFDKNIHTSQLQDADGNEASESEIKQWKKGDLELYSANFVISVSIISEIDFNDEDLTSLTGIGVYKKGGKLGKKATYVPKRDIAEVEVEKNGKTKYVDGADLLDGVYVKKSKFGKGGKTTTNSKEVRDAVKKHILESVYDENEKQFKNFDEASKYLAEEFKRVADYRNNQSKFPNNQDRFTDYLKGIPFHFEYTDEGLEKFLNGLGINPTNKEYTGDQMWKLYGALIWKEVYPKYSKYAEGGNINRSDSGELNGMYLDSLSEEKKKEILTNIAKHYDISLEEANEEVRDSDAELLFEYTADNEKLSLTIYKEIEAMITTYAKGGQVSTYKKANWRFW